MQSIETNRALHDTATVRYEGCKHARYGQARFPHDVCAASARPIHSARAPPDRIGHFVQPHMCKNLELDTFLFQKPKNKKGHHNPPNEAGFNLLEFDYFVFSYHYHYLDETCHRWVNAYSKSLHNNRTYAARIQWLRTY